MTSASLPDERQVLDALRSIIDPELGIGIVDLGLIYAVEIEGRRIRVDMTMTSPACPTASLMADEAHAAVVALAPDADVEVDLVWDPPWEPGRMSDEAKKKLGW